MNIAIAIPVHGSQKRRELAKRILLYYETLDIPGVDITTIVIDNALHEDSFAGEVLMHYDESGPLGGKFNAGISAGKVFDVDGVMIVGSDDLIAPAVFERIRDEKPYYQEIRGVHFYNAETGEMVFAWKSHCGAGKYFSRAFLDACDWQPYDDTADKNVDNGPSRFLTNGGDVMQAKSNEPLCIDIKCFGENMTAWSIVSGYQAEGVDKEACFALMDGEWESRWRSPRT